MAKILALDLGTKTGWCIFNLANSELVCGVIDSKSSNVYLEYFNNINQLFADHKDIKCIVYEQVQFASKGTSGKLYSYFEGVLYLCGFPIIGVGVSTIKKHTTGNGSAIKDQMIDAVTKRLANNGIVISLKKRQKKIDHNMIDATALMFYALDNFDSVIKPHINSSAISSNLTH